MTTALASHGASAVQRVFATNRMLFETIEVVGLPFDNRDLAEALCHALREGLAFPAPVPDSPEILPEAASSGYFGIVTRADLPPELAEALFADQVGQYVGPVVYDRQYWVFQVLLARKAELTDAVYEYCERLLGVTRG